MFLDTFPYTGHTTAGDALLAGVPTVTMAGTSFASRVALSLFNDLGLTTGVASSYEDYFEKALAFASDSFLRENVREYLTYNVQAENWPVKAEQQAEGFMELLTQI
jgi:predicted O-linked N-acetylglucosamine transferase (SPINDLY family)